ncbi:MAG: hypothetical protein CVU65_02705 [Deltaproteobacteria bacterium HGW-Deltaproteobacteria-22]|nr:MAG: hypothetical protein CVU65_02705 [Deltaproteobacteria bacterium HGW-Deltaproteobacteria-22]
MPNAALGPSPRGQCGRKERLMENLKNSARVLGYIKGILNYKETPGYVLLNPGPVLTTPRVKAALVHHDTCHRDTDFAVLVRNLRSKLKKVFRGDERHEVVLITGSGTSGIEATISSTIPEDKKILVLINGAFGERYREVATVHRLNMEVLDFGWCNPMDVSAVEAKLAADPEICAVMLAHHETSVGLINPIGEIGAICRRYDRLLLVDAVSSLGAEDLDVVRDNIDICLSSANKAMQAIAGVAFVCVNDRAWKVIETVRPRVYYLDLKRYRKYAIEEELTPFTPAVNGFFALDAAVDELLEDGVESRWELYRERNRFLRENFLSMGLTFLDVAGQRSSTLTIVKVPEYITYSELYDRMKGYGFIIYGCKGILTDTYFQIANMGDLSDEMLQSFVNTLQFVLYRARREAGLAADMVEEPKVVDAIR